MARDVRPPRTTRTAGGRPTRGPARSHEEIASLYGWHPVVEALRNPRRRLRRLLVTENSARRLQAEIGALPVPAEIVRADEISRRVEPDAVHQGLYLEADPLDGPDIGALEPGMVVLALDQITDPHNVGAIVRTAAAFGVGALITTARHSPSATGVLAKAASGGLEHVPFVVVRNLADALIELGRQSFRRIGLDSSGPETLRSVSPAPSTVLVLGAEGRGLRQRTRECCDVVARLEMPGAIKSLNVSNAAAIALYAVTEQRATPVEGGRTAT